jgi:RsiW-degrading membrane proteinase PrsW (M82 family)
MQFLLLALGGLFPIAVLLALCAWLLRRRQPPESYREIALCFALGLVSVVIAVLFALPLDAFTLSFAGRPLALGIYDALIVAGLPEELARYCVLRWRLGRRINDLDARLCLLLGALVGLGFAALENTAYCIGGDWSAVWGRAITSVPLHALSGAIVAYAVGYSLRKRQVVWSIMGVATTTLLHGINNFNFKLWYSGSSPSDDIELPTEGLGALLITGWPSNIAVVLLLSAIVTWLAYRPIESASTEPRAGER